MTTTTTKYIFDYDDTLVGWLPDFRRWLVQQEVGVPDHDPTCWNLAKWLGTTPEAMRLLIEDFNTSWYIKYLRPLDGVVAGLSDLSSRPDVDLHLVTSCGVLQNTLIYRRQNIAANFTRSWIGFRSTHLLDLGVSKKPAFNIIAAGAPERCVLLEDNYRHALTAAEMGMASFCLRRSHNREDEKYSSQSVTWVDNFNHFMSEI